MKPSNFLVHDGHIKLSDFGLTMLMQNMKDAPAAGTISYLAPEIFLNQEVTSKVDVYDPLPLFFSTWSRFVLTLVNRFAFGVVLWEVLHPGTKLYPTIRTIKDYETVVCKLGKRMDISPELPPPLVELIKDCWAQDPEARPNMAKVFFISALTHPLLASFHKSFWNNTYLLCRFTTDWTAWQL